MARSRDPEQEAKAYIDAALEAQRRLGYKGKVPKEPYRRAVREAATMIETLNGPRKPDAAA